MALTTAWYLYSKESICLTICAYVILFHLVPPDLPHEVAFFLFVYRGCPRAAQWTMDLVTIDLGHVQLDGFSTLYRMRYAISFADKITCCGTTMHSLTGFFKRSIH